MLECHWCKRMFGPKNCKVLEFSTRTSNAWTFAAFWVHFVNVNHDENIHVHPTVGCARQYGKRPTRGFKDMVKMNWKNPCFEVFLEC